MHDIRLASHNHLNSKVEMECPGYTYQTQKNCVIGLNGKKERGEIINCNDEYSIEGKKVGRK